MAFTTINKERRSFAHSSNANKVRLYPNPKARAIALAISSDLIGAIGFDKYAEVMLGTGDDTGKLLIRPATTGYGVRQPKTGRAAMVTIPAAIHFRKKPAVATPVRHEVTSDGLVVDLSAFLLPASDGNGVVASALNEARAA